MAGAYAKTAKLRLVARAEMSAAGQRAYDHIVASRKLNYIPGLFSAMGHSPGAMEAAASVGEHVRFHSVLDLDLREIVICEVAQIVNNPYEWCHHIWRLPADLQRKVGTDAILAEKAPTGAVARFSRLVAANETVPDALIEDIRASLGDAGLVDLTVMVGYYQLVGSFCRVMGLTLEPEVKFVPFNG